MLVPCPPTCSLRSSWSSLGVPGLQGHQKEEEEEAGEDHGPSARTTLLLLLLLLPPLPERCPQLAWHSTSKHGSVTSEPRRATRSARRPQCTPVASESLNLYTIAFPCSTRAWKEQKWRRWTYFGRQHCLWECTGTRVLLPRNQSISNVSYKDCIKKPVASAFTCYYFCQAAF